MLGNSEKKIITHLYYLCWHNTNYTDGLLYFVRTERLLFKLKISEYF